MTDRGVCGRRGGGDVERAIESAHWHQGRACLECVQGSVHNRNGFFYPSQQIFFFKNIQNLKWVMLVCFVEEKGCFAVRAPLIARMMCGGGVIYPCDDTVASNEPRTA